MRQYQVLALHSMHLQGCLLQASAANLAAHQKVKKTIYFKRPCYRAEVVRTGVTVSHSLISDRDALAGSTAFAFPQVCGKQPGTLRRAL